MRTTIEEMKKGSCDQGTELAGGKRQMKIISG
jgi:hypothetical protein